MYATSENTTGSVPAFLMKVWSLVEDPSTDDLIYWDASGTSFHVFDQQRFSREILPMYFKHNNIASFIRQLNMYGFRKVSHIDKGGLKIENDDLHFQHPYFQKGQRELLQHIKRRVSNQNLRAVDTVSSVIGNGAPRVLASVNQLQAKQEDMDKNLDYIKRENKLLWREVALLRQRHHKQQEILNKLIQFLVSLVSSNRTGLTIPPIKCGPLAIDSIQTTASTATNTEPVVNQMPAEQKAYTIQSPKAGDVLMPTTSGPIIHELPAESPQSSAMSPKLETVMSLQDALNSYEWPPVVAENSVVSNTSPPPSSNAKVSNTSPSPNSNVRRKRPSDQPSSPSPTKKATQSSVPPRDDVLLTPQPQEVDMTLQDLGLLTGAAKNSVFDDSVVPAANLGDDHFLNSTNDFDLLNSDLDGVRGLLQDQYKMDPGILMDLFDTAHPWSIVLEKPEDELVPAALKECDPSTSSGSDKQGSSTELMKYKPKEAFPDFLGDNLIGNIDDID